MKLKIAAGIWALSVLVALIISAVVGGRAGGAFLVILAATVVDIFVIVPALICGWAVNRVSELAGALILVAVADVILRAALSGMPNPFELIAITLLSLGAGFSAGAVREYRDRRQATQS
jgi:hypothetical protein